MTLNGPSLLMIHMTWPLLQMRESADDLEWAHPVSQEELTIPMNRPLLQMRESANDLEWAHLCKWEKLPTASNGLIVTYEKCC
jgi:hypothetical protein